MRSLAYCPVGSTGYSSASLFERASLVGVEEVQPGCKILRERVLHRLQRGSGDHENALLSRRMSKTLRYKADGWAFCPISPEVPTRERVAMW